MELHCFGDETVIAGYWTAGYISAVGCVRLHYQLPDSSCLSKAALHSVNETSDRSKEKDAEESRLRHFF